MTWGEILWCHLNRSIVCRGNFESRHVVFYRSSCFHFVTMFYKTSKQINLWMVFVLVKTSSDILFCDYSHKYILFISVLWSLDIHFTGQYRIASNTWKKQSVCHLSTKWCSISGSTKTICDVTLNRIKLYL